MGIILRIILFFVVVNYLVKLFFRFFFGIRQSRGGRYQRQQRSYQQQSRQQQQQRKRPEAQEDRILDFQRKSFESTDVEDADFVEIKE